MSFVTSYISMRFKISSKQLLETLSVSILVGESILEERVYHNCNTYVYHKYTMTYIVELNMVDFDDILGRSNFRILCLS